MIGEDRADILQIDGSSPAKTSAKSSSKKKGDDAKDVVILGYDGTEGGDTAVGVKTKPAKTKKKDSSVPSHLFCLKDTCRFFVKKGSQCKFDSVFDMAQDQSTKIDAVEKQAKRIENVESRIESFGKLDQLDKLQKIDKIDAVDEILTKIAAVEAQLKKSESTNTDKTADKTSAKVTKELDKFWKFQTQSVTELIASMGDVEKKQEASFVELRKNLDKSLDAWKPDLDLKPIEDVRGGIDKLREAIESREDGIENFSTTVSELVLNIDDTLKALQEKNEVLAKRVEEMEASLPQFDEYIKKMEISLAKGLESASGPNVSDDIKSLDERFKERLEDIVGAHKRLEENLESWSNTIEDRVKEVGDRQDTWKEYFERLEKKQAEVFDLVQADKGHPDDESMTFKKKEAKKYNNLGVTSFHNGEFELARDQFLEAVELDPKFAESWNNLGLVYTELQDEDGATVAFSKAIDINPDLPASYNNLGYIYYKQGRYDKAIEMYDEALSRSADNSSAYTNLGNAHFKQGDRENAKRAWEKALEIDPGNEKASRNLKRLDRE